MILGFVNRFEEVIPRICCACNTKTRCYAEKAIKTISEHTETNVFELIQRLLDHTQTSRIIEDYLISESRCICDECLQKLNEYDLACVTAERIGNKLRQMILHTNLGFPKNLSPIDREEKAVTNEPNDMFDVNFGGNVIDEPATGVEANANVKIQEDEILEESDDLIGRLNASNKRVYECQICLLKFGLRKDLKKHRAKHRIDEIRFRCEICNFNPNDEIALAEHREMHIGLSPLQCVICKKSFNHKRNINPHMRLHTGQKKYQCDRCGKEYFHKSSFSLHMSYHNGIRRERCPYCTRQFIAKTDLEKHIRTHTGEKPYPCDICGKRFARRDNMREHRKIHDKQKMGKPYLCSFCDCAFARRSKLNKHLDKHGVMSEVRI